MIQSFRRNYNFSTRRSDSIIEEYPSNFMRKLIFIHSNQIKNIPHLKTISIIEREK